MRSSEHGFYIAPGKVGAIQSELCRPPDCGHVHNNCNSSNNTAFLASPGVSVPAVVLLSRLTSVRCLWAGEVLEAAVHAGQRPHAQGAEKGVSDAADAALAAAAAALRSSSWQQYVPLTAIVWRAAPNDATHAYVCVCVWVWHVCCGRVHCGRGIGHMPPSQPYSSWLMSVDTGMPRRPHSCVCSRSRPHNRSS